MLIVGLTGSIGMGKSTVGGWFSARGFPVLDADRVVHDLYAGDAVTPIGALVADAIVEGAVDRGRLSAALQADPALFERLEAIVHPLVRERQRGFLEQTATAGAAGAVLDIPLLFETNGDARVDVVVVCHADADVQRARVLARAGMTAEKFAAISARQMPSDEKCRYADFVIDTGRSLAESEAAVDRLAAVLRHRKGTALKRVWLNEGGSDVAGNRARHGNDGAQSESR